MDKENNKKEKETEINEDTSFDLDLSDNDNEIVSEEANLGEIVKQFREKLKKCATEKQEFLGGWQRERADFVNYKKREVEEKKELFKKVYEEIILDIIPVADNFEMAFSNKEAWERVSKEWRIGVECIYSQLLLIFDKYNLKQLNPIREKFNPNFHISIDTIDVEKKEDDNIIIEVRQKGYKLENTVIRPASVKVGLYKKN